MAKGNVVEATDARRSLAERIASSRYVNRSARLRDLLLYLVDQVLDGHAGEIHEQEVGHKVFDRPPDYDTVSDNIVRVHASMLRKRLEQYFSSEGAHESLILEIPKGNYAPVFRTRHIDPVPTPIPEPPADRHWPVWVLAATAFLFACSTVYLLVRSPSSGRSVDAGPNVRLLWEQLFQPNRPTDIVLDDGAVGLYQELTGRALPLSSYYDRAYLRSDQDATSSILLRRLTSVSGTNFVWKLAQMRGVGQRPALLRFARDYSFRELKANNALLLGNSHSNPWVEPFESKLGLRWSYDQSTGTYYPVDAWAPATKYKPGGPGDGHDGYCAISLLPNLGHTGNVLLIAGTGGSAINAGADFLAHEQAVAGIRRSLGSSKPETFPAFEALIKVKGRGALPRDATVVLVRKPKT